VRDFDVGVVLRREVRRQACRQKRSVIMFERNDLPFRKVAAKLADMPALPYPLQENELQRPQVTEQRTSRACLPEFPLPYP
jgi:hypothetical protein